MQFVARGAGYTAFLAPSEATLTLGRAVLRLKPIGGNAAARAVGDDDHPGVAHYARGASLASRISAPTYRRVRYADVYPGIDHVYYARSRRLEYDFVVAPGADPDRIRLAVEGLSFLADDGVTGTDQAATMHSRPLVVVAGQGRSLADASYGELRLRIRGARGRRERRPSHDRSTTSR